MINIYIYIYIYLSGWLTSHTSHMNTIYFSPSEQVLILWYITKFYFKKLLIPVLGVLIKSITK